MIMVTHSNKGKIQIPAYDVNIWRRVEKRVKWSTWINLAPIQEYNLVRGAVKGIKSTF